MWTWAVKDSDRAIGTAVTLTDDEKMMLSHVAATGSLGMTIFDLADIPGKAESWRWTMHEAAQSIGRFGLVTDRYPNGRVRNAGKVCWLSETGQARFDALRSTAMRVNAQSCCEYMITLPCVCRYRSYCPVHGGDCHGTHD